MKVGNKLQADNKVFLLSVMLQNERELNNEF